MINQDEKVLPRYILLADDASNNLINKISNEVIKVIHSVDNNDINKIFNEINMRKDQKEFSFIITILNSVLCKTLTSLKSPGGEKDQMREIYTFILKNFIDGVWKNINENDSEVH